jgi:hypothetical protein
MCLHPSKKSPLHMLSFTDILIDAQVTTHLHIEYVKNGLCVCVIEHVTA